MASKSPVALILGAGANIGKSVGRAFAAKGYKVALAARSLREEDSTPDHLNVRSDFSDPESIEKVFTKVKSQLGSPSVVIYNASASTACDAKNPLKLPLKDFTHDLTINTTSAFVAAQQAALAFEELPDSASRTFIYTGNCTNVLAIVPYMDLGVGKSATAHVIQCASEAYKSKGFKFYYADERQADGSPSYSGIDGPAHAEFYTQLAEGDSQGPWQQTEGAARGRKASTGRSEACDICHKKKIRCLPSNQGCAHCIKLDALCHFTPTPPKKKPRKPAAFKYIQQLEERLKNMEGLLEKGLPATQQAPTDFMLDESIMNLDTNGTTEGDTGVRDLQMAMVNQQAVSSNDGFLADLSCSPWLQGNGKIPGKISLIDNDLLSPRRPFASGKESLSLGPFSLPTFQGLPTRLVALELVKDAFRSSNNAFPLFDEQSFLQQLENQYPSSSPSDPAWWACINVVLAIAHRFRSMRNLETEYENTQACGYLHSNGIVVSGLNVLHHSLPAVQALVFTASAVRLAHAMGLHRKTQSMGFTPAETEQGRRVFWTAYFLDKDISLRMGQPFTQDDDDMDAELPTENITELRVCSGEPCSVDFFRCRIGLAIIQGQFYQRLYSVQASWKSEVQRETAAQELHSILSYWKRGVKIDFYDDSLVPFQAHLKPDIVHLLILRFTYLNCLIMIDRHLPAKEQSSVDASSESPEPLERVCIYESRKAVRLIQTTPHGDYACVWLLLHPIFAAVTTLLGNVVNSPESPRTRSDFQVVQPFIRLVELLAADNRTCARSEKAKKMHASCSDWMARATEAVDWADMGFNRTGLIQVS
ncbi:hypothetical protein FZEAL_5500 [Fusarium zealandicum]|uniref:Zn(2)-C6 fungal-type domain-containing protein n=1 Tax=Fusarium zealandicum TaxID=1053134 RepID=A0A8H4UKE3_9HYPO|nr:hypothetical protein FZEAL_5500 [Fusarium zealandicum]